MTHASDLPKEPVGSGAETLLEFPVIFHSRLWGWLKVIWRRKCWL